MLTEPLRRLAGRPDFRRNPVKAIAKRVAWRVRWMGTSRPVQLKLANGLSLSAPKGAVGALIYYLGNSEPDTARLIESYLKPGMVFFDVGAHIGEYSLMASRLVAPHGSVHAFEAQPDTFELLAANCAANRAANVTCNACAVSDGEGELEFDLCAEPAMSSIASAQDLPQKRVARIRVPSLSLDNYCLQHRAWPDLLKIDVEGAEALVLHGALELLRRRPAPAVIFECLPETYSRFGFTAEAVTSYLHGLGYTVRPMTSGYNLIATRN